MLIVPGTWARANAAAGRVSTTTPPPRSTSPIVAGGARRQRAERLAARRAGAVPRPQLHVVGEGAEPGERAKQGAGAALHRPAHAGRLLEQVRPPDVADEHE